MQADASGADQGLERSLFEHVSEKYGKAAHFNMRRLPFAAILQRHFTEVARPRERNSGEAPRRRPP
jgi:hypothetical protein